MSDVTWQADAAGVYFSDRFGVPPASLESYGAFDVSLVEDVPVFIDPFLLFNAEKAEYQALHEQILEYLRFLKDKASEPLNPGLIAAWYKFGEVKQNWLGFTVGSNRGRGLGEKFARALYASLTDLLSNFGDESITQSSHLEKLALIQDGVGRDMISDFTTNLVKHYLLRYTEAFALEHLAPEYCRTVQVPRAAFNYRTESWATRAYTLPWTEGDFVILTPIDLLTTEDTWINRSDMVRSFDAISAAVPDEELRAKANNYLSRMLTRNATEKERVEAVAKVLREFPELIDYYIRLKEERGDLAASSSLKQVVATQALLRDQVQKAAQGLAATTGFFSQPWTSYEEALEAVKTFKHYVEDKDGWKVINRGDGQPLAKESEVQGFFGLLLQASRFDVNREPNNGRGPVDFKISMGLDKTLIEFKLANNSSLKRNLEKQVAIYAAANDTRLSVTVVICYTASEISKVQAILDELGLGQSTGKKDVVIVDASPKVSASKV